MIDPEIFTSVATPTEAERSQRFKWPKVELHCHLEGSPRLETIYQLGVLRRRRTLGELAKARLPFEQSWSDFGELEEQVVIPDGETVPNLLIFLERFKFFMNLVQGDRDAIYRIVYECLEDCYKQRIVYIEIRFCPMLLASAKIEPHFRSYGDLTPDDVMEIVKLAMDAGERQFGVKSKLILCSIVGLWDYAVPIAHMAVKYRDYVCGVDVAGYENGHVYKTRKEKQQIEAFKIARENGISRTAHAGEAPHAGGPTSIQNALDVLDVDRIGHGYHAIASEKLYKRIKEERIHLECCFTSSCKIGGYWNADLSKHPVKRFMKDKINMSLSTDDPTLFGNSLEIDYRKILEGLDMDESDLMEANLNAARSAFLPEDERHELISFLEKEYGKYKITKF